MSENKNVIFQNTWKARFAFKSNLKDEKMDLLFGYLAGYCELRSYVQVLVLPSAKGKLKECDLGQGAGGSMNELKEGKITFKIDMEGGLYRMSKINRELSCVSWDLSGAL